MKQLAVLIPIVLACSSPLKSRAPDGGSPDVGATGNGGAMATGGATDTLASGGSVGTGGSTSSADGSASTVDLDTCSTDADCTMCIWETTPTDWNVCVGFYCCGGKVATTARCEANQAAWNRFCPGQLPQEESCPCSNISQDCLPTCVGGRCGLYSCPLAFGDAAPEVASVADDGGGGIGDGAGEVIATRDGPPEDVGLGDTLALPPTGCGSAFLNVFPQDNTIPGWTVDPTNSQTAGRVAATARTESDVENLIDGASHAFFAGPNTPMTFAWQNYVSTTVTDAPAPAYATVSLYVLQMASANQASGLYTSLLTNPLYSEMAWSAPGPPPIGTDSRIADAGGHWWINFYKGNCYVEVSLSPSYGPAPDYTPKDTNTKAAAMTFSQAVASKM